MFLPSVSLHAMDLIVASKLVIPTTASSNVCVFLTMCSFMIEIEETETQDRDII